MRKKHALSLLAACLIFFTGCHGNVRKKNALAPLYGDPLDFIAEKLSTGHDKKADCKVAVLPFFYSDRAGSADGDIISERVLTRMTQKSGMQLVERALLRKMLEELRLQRSGIMDPDSIYSLGKMLGAGEVVTGSLYRVKNGNIEVNARLVRVETGAVLAAASAVVPVDWETEPHGTTRPAIQARPRPVPAQAPFAPAPAPAWAAPENAFTLYGHDQKFLTDSVYGDFEASIEMMFTGMESSGGLIFRTAEKGGFYQYEWYSDGSNEQRNQLALMTEAGWERLVPPLLRIARTNQWYQLKVQAKGRSIKCYLDGEQVIQAENDLYPSPARVGVRVWLTNAGNFRNFKIRRI